MSLIIGTRLHLNSLRKLPIGVDVIAAIKARAEREGKLLLRAIALLFEWRSDVLIGNNEQTNDGILYDNEPLATEGIHV